MVFAYTMLVTDGAPVIHDDLEVGLTFSSHQASV